ncbi:MAG: excinuclease [Clostridia bacterium]|jgi:protein arginine kinase activator|nr:excinuclease [Clostridia bacterium]
MQCDRCKNNIATVHIVKLVNGSKQEFNLCQDCAKESKEIDLSDSLNFHNSFSFQNILSGLMDYFDQSQRRSTVKEDLCPTCGTTYAEFKKTGILGCNNCYNYFNSVIMPVVRRVQGNVEHLGKIPARTGKDIAGKRRLRSLKEELQKAILMEEYERAAELRDQIRDLQKSEGEI